jgi:hypothetical protein
MATRTYSKQFGTKTINVKARKDLAEQVLSRLARLQPKEIIKYQLELSGIKGTTEGLHKERQSLTWMMYFGQGVPVLSNQAEYQAEYQAWLDSTPDLITEDQIKHEVKRADELFYRFVKRDDKRTTLEEHTEQQAVQEKQRQELEEKQAIEAKARQEREAIERVQILKDYAFLQTMEQAEANSKRDYVSNHALASKNIKTELAHVFPGQDFSVKSKSFSMGDDVSISWTDGPTTKEVDAIVDKYQYSQFNAMEDYSESRKTGQFFRGLFGSAKYVSTSRTVTDDRYREAAEALGITDYSPDFNFSHDSRVMLNRHMSETSFYIAPVAQEAPAIEDSGTAQPTASGPVQVSRNEEKQGIEIKFDNKPGPDTLEALKQHGFRWSRFQGLWWAKYRDSRWAFALSLQGDNSPDGLPETDSTTPGNMAAYYVVGDCETGTVSGTVLTYGGKFKAMADRLTKDIEDKRRPMTQNPTPKRCYQRDSRLHDANNLERLQKLLYALDGLGDDIPQALRGITTKQALASLVHKGTTGAGGYYACIESDKYSYDTPAALAAQALIEGKEDPEQKAKEELERLERDLIFQNIPGFFPTPPEVVDRMLAHLEIEPGDTVYDPQAGTGAILQRVLERCPGADCSGMELRPSLVDICKRKGLQVEDADCLNGWVGQYDFILMNPPFENAMDITHINRAYGHLKEGGVLVGICANGPRQQAQLMPQVDHWEALPDGAFKQSGTGVSTALLVWRR